MSPRFPAVRVIKAQQFWKLKKNLKNLVKQGLRSERNADITRKSRDEISVSDAAVKR